MDKNNIYENWKQEKNSSEVPDDFAYNVMQKIYQQNTNSQEIKTIRLSWLYHSQLVKAGMLIAAASVGFFRIILLILLVLEF